MPYEFNGRINVPPNIRNNKQAVVGKFDLRDIAYICVAGGFFFLGFNFCKTLEFTNMISLLVGLILAAPIILVGFKKWNGLKFEDYIFVFKSNKLNSSNIRINNSDNLFEIIENTKNFNQNNEEVKLNPLAKAIYNATTKNKKQNNKTPQQKTIKKEKINKRSRKQKKKKLIKTEQQYILKSAKSLLLKENIKDLNDFIGLLHREYNIDSQIFDTYRESFILRRISFKTNRLKRYVSGEHINKILKLENLKNYINLINQNTLTEKQKNNLLFTNNIKKKNIKKKIKQDIVIYK